jgi:dTDP-4-amino-4,6-dideoxygalactose transaminase
MITTDDDELARRMRNFINHGENAGDRIGLNLRMPELCAAVAIEQLRRGPEIVGGRVGQAEAILDAIGDIPGLPVIREGCTHSFYTIPFTFRDDLRTGNSDVNVFFYTARKRAAFCASLREDDIPIVEGYASGPLYRLPAFENYATACPIAEDLHDSRLFYFENCAWDLDGNDIIKIGDAFKRAAEKWL